jgi:hypothetical protein
LQFTLLPDRLCYEDAPGVRAEVQYMPLDRVPVRAMPRGYKPAIGVALIDERYIRVSICVRFAAEGWRVAGSTRVSDASILSGASRGPEHFMELQTRTQPVPALQHGRATL